MVDKNKEFVELMLKKAKDKPTEVKDPFSNLEVEKIENLTKEIMEKKPPKK